MQLILINKSGEPSQFALTPLRLKVFGCVAVLVCAGLVSTGFVLKSSDFVDAAVIEKEIEIAKDQLRAEGKPEAMLDNIAKGKIRRFFKDNTLVNQDYIKDSKQSVTAYVKSVNPDLVVTGFKRLALK